MRHVRRKHVRYVIESINTISGYGTNRPMGHVDFYANGEGEQPGCGALNMVSSIWYTQ